MAMEDGIEPFNLAISRQQISHDGRQLRTTLKSPFLPPSVQVPDKTRW
jgi:hypothetical protein